MAVQECDLWLCVDAGGDYGIGKDEDAAKEAYEADIQSLADSYGFRLIKVVVRVPIADEQPELTGDAPEEGAATLTVK